MTSSQTRLPDGTLELAIRVPWEDIKKEYTAVVGDFVQGSQMPGFRRGKAPRKLVEEKLDKTKTYEEVLKRVIPKVYNDAVTQEKIKPVVTPKVELLEAHEGKDWVIKAITCEKPLLTIGDYKKALRSLSRDKKNKIWIPGETKKDEEDKPQKPTLDEVVPALLSVVTSTIPAILLDHEVNRLLSDLIDQTKKLGLTVEQYLASTGRTGESLRKEYEDQARRTIILELALEEIADKESIILSDDDIEAVLKTAKSDEERKTLESQRYYLASLLRRQKTLDMLAGL